MEGRKDRKKIMDRDTSVVDCVVAAAPCDRFSPWVFHVQQVKGQGSRAPITPWSTAWCAIARLSAFVRALARTSFLQEMLRKFRDLLSLFSRGCVNREVQTVNWEAGKEGAAETGVNSGLKKAHKCKPWIRHFQPRKFQCFSSQCALHGLRALDFLWVLNKSAKFLPKLSNPEMLGENQERFTDELLWVCRNKLLVGPPSQNRSCAPQERTLVHWWSWWKSSREQVHCHIRMTLLHRWHQFRLQQWVSSAHGSPLGTKKRAQYHPNRKRYMRILLFWDLTYEFNTHTHTWKFWAPSILNWMHIPRVFRINYLVTDTNTHTWKMFLANEFKFNTRIHIHQKIAGNSKCIYSRAHGN